MGGSLEPIRFRDERSVPVSVNVNWGPPPEGPRDVVNVPLQVGPKEELRVWILSEHVVGVNVHWDGQRTRPCTGGVDDAGEIHACWHANCEDARRWQGWLAVSRVGYREVRLLCVTPSVMSSCRQLMSAASVRGWRLDIKRFGGKANGRMQGRLWQESVVPGLCVPPDVKRVLCKMWEAPLRDVPLSQEADRKEQQERRLDRDEEIPFGE